MSEIDSELAREFDAFSATIAKPKRGRPSGSGKGTTSRKNLAPISDGLETLITVANNAFAAGSKWGRYALQNEEIKNLTKALMIELEHNAKARNVLAKLGANSPHIPLIECCLSIGLSRYVMYQQEKGTSVRLEPEPIRPTPVASEVPATPVDVSRVAYVNP